MTRNKHDIIRERRLRQKVERVEADWHPRDVQDQSWMRWARCPICRDKYCVNNNAKREVRPTRVEGVAVCANCWARKGAKRRVKMYKIVRDLAKCGELTDEDVLVITGDKIGLLIRQAKELME